MSQKQTRRNSPSEALLSALGVTSMKTKVELGARLVKLELVPSQNRLLIRGLGWNRKRFGLTHA
jgi:hypothetical protein